MTPAFASEHSLCTDHCNAVNSNTEEHLPQITCVLLILPSGTTLMTTLAPGNPSLD